MGRFLPANDEELVRSTRPHPFAYAGSYAAAWSWVAWGVAGSLAGQAMWGHALAYPVFLVLVAGHGFLRTRVRGDTRLWWYHGVAALAVAGGWAVDATGTYRLPEPWAAWQPAALGAALTVASWMGREAERRSRTSYVTTRRVVARRGVATSRETQVLWKDVETLEAVQGILGRLFNFGRIRLVLKRRRRKRTKTKKADVETEEDEALELLGVPRFEEARRDLNSLLDEVRLSEKQRRKRIEERRLKDSMHRLSQWKPHGRT